MDGASRKAYEGRLPNLGWFGSRMGTIASALDDIMRASRAMNDHKEKKEDTRGREAETRGWQKFQPCSPFIGKSRVKVTRREGADIVSCGCRPQWKGQTCCQGCSKRRSGRLDDHECKLTLNHDHK